MNKIDLIIDALETGLKLTDGFISEWNQINKGLAAARELKALKPVAWQVMDENDALIEFSIKDIAQDWITTELFRGSSIVYRIRPLYALDGEQA